MTTESAQAPASTAEKPWPVRTVARKIGDWIHRLGTVWVEGQVTQVNSRPNTQTAFLTLRDPSADVSMPSSLPFPRSQSAAEPSGGRGL